MLRVVLILAAICAAAAVASAGPAPRRVLTIDEQQAWSGVGRLNFARSRYCSAALIGPQTVLTAAHCVVDDANRPYPASRLRFVAGLRDGFHMANRRANAAATHPDWSGYQPGGGVKVAGDVALVTLESPLSAIEARVFPLGPPPDVGADVTLVSYGRGRDGALSIQEPCQVLERWRGSLTLNCDSIYGTSGAPVFYRGAVVAVVSASEKPDVNQGLTYAAIPGPFARGQSAGGTSGAAGGATGGATGTVRDRFRSAPSGGTRLPGAKKAPSG